MNTLLEARIGFFVEDGNGLVVPIEASIDTGYTGHVTLKPDMIAALGLPWLTSRHIMLGNGAVVQVEVHTATVIWDSQFRPVEVDAVDTGALVGMGMLFGYELKMRVVHGGQIWIDHVP